jgi:hypothetical protein
MRALCLTRSLQAIRRNIDFNGADDLRKLTPNQGDAWCAQYMRKEHVVDTPMQRRHVRAPRQGTPLRRGGP